MRTNLDLVMKAQVIECITDLSENTEPLSMVDMPVPEPGAGEVLLKVRTCGVCHTELDEIEGRTPPAFFPIVPGHQVVGEVVAQGSEVSKPDFGSRVGVAWIYSACGECELCLDGKENLCKDFRATGRDAHGGYAEYMVVPAVMLTLFRKFFQMPKLLLCCVREWSDIVR
ncbi:alcohol dehydrogenase catalytic domain-containing protein [Prosthecochloris sp. SCSIO W1102]|uniref:alcohol dehydrogenase catalytic domain-containing protein n=1 Tax=Prosthecochloris sp. SCSIO W1102 TaxID=2992243 RepID=UPI00223E5C4C|nr:alcohol dehydrogenase catalytic domain-containing protein [Prosthecochloris sp. SCSIO W1102]UZJ39526.1 alcohol dehydrogenase catalytic domain-containing protein [Prosthecochloris sp. SCSIO W1102]